MSSGEDSRHYGGIFVVIHPGLCHGGVRTREENNSIRLGMWRETRRNNNYQRIHFFLLLECTQSAASLILHCHGATAAPAPAACAIMPRVRAAEDQVRQEEPLCKLRLRWNPVRFPGPQRRPRRRGPTGPSAGHARVCPSAFATGPPCWYE